MGKKIILRSIIISFILLSVQFIPNIQAKIEGESINLEIDIETNYYAVITGCQTYKNSSYNKKELVDSTKMLYDALISCKNWNSSNIILLQNNNATKENITHALINMSNRVGPNDVFLFSWDGHGTMVKDIDEDEKKYDPKDKFDEAICPYDTGNEFDETNQTCKFLITDDDLNYYFSKINAKGMFLIFNSCVSGGLVSKLSLKDKFLRSFKKDFQRNTSDIDAENRVVLMSTPDEKSGYGSRDLPFVLSLTYSLSFSIMTMNSLISDISENETEETISEKDFFKILDDNVVSAEELFIPTKSIYKYQSLSFWSGLAYYNYALIKNIIKPIYLLLLSPILVILSPLFLIGVKIFFNQRGIPMGRNNANIRDDYKGDLPIIEI